MDIFELFKTWVNHPKGGSGRSNLDNTDECWRKLLQDIRKWENSEDKYENKVAKYLLYTGKIRRVHIGLDEVNYNNHYVSWTSAEKLEDLYWYNSSSAHTIITAEATKDNPGISVKGFIEVVKLEIKNFELNSPAIRAEQEVIFPLQEKSILSIVKIKKR
ncbi:hypothetical protein B5V88_07085 [Heyndrickxia sporothermodurans]|uniref:Uncharacterized protein n=1 Tax=Heyndrickxia sporothermodurans TaxID=46224 RepID=A0AB37HJ19_9BACI|nr:hypothetical protein [Heyndrickxia sporothermodurans]MBL5767363.1 hypothetical protein [Heyndrickxia sporothermodurans]MBL5770836.1 hypothetical protein [Heyndrickxia sporothermodurans]MBL5774476.1 hypothetical protein [Heyndrickxia sporothermodurans]MBL5779560.1 hypothetical protein [Heyndrickxia sporothermodurans]MBL5781563.1 hypothetical protein [Heyndrickxia sporothermodurans]